MRKRIFRSICSVTFLVLIISLLFVTESTYRYFSEVQEQHIRNQLELVSAGVELVGEKYFSSFKLEKIRVTWISEDGTVLFDNEKSATEMENHMERPEIREAKEFGYGESSRYSSTLLEKQTYCAKKISNNSVIRISDSQSNVLTLLMSLSRPICLVILVIIILAFLAARNLSRKIVEPINTIDLNHPSESEIYEELTPLLTRLTLQQNQLKNDRAELEKTEQIRQEFTANVSHEMKTPLHVISGYAELMKNGLVAEQDIQPFAEKIFDESNRLATLVGDVIDLSRLDSCVPELESERTDLYRIAENVIESLEDFAEEKNVQIRLKGSIAEMNGIPNLLHSIIFNLCDNAIRYNREGGIVDVTVEDKDNNVILTVSDTGIGISEEHLERIFERFYRVDKSHSREVGGTGLGLSIVKHAVALHNGKITVDSIPDQGTVIMIVFPKVDFT